MREVQKKIIKTLHIKLSYYYYILHILMTIKQYLIMLYLLDKSAFTYQKLDKLAFILSLETTDSLRVFCVLVSIYMYTYIGVGFINKRLELKRF
jgi:hypothetical protein